MDPTLVPSISDAFITPPPSPTKPEMAGSQHHLSPWIPPLFPASMTLLSPPHPPNQTPNGWVKWWFKSMDPTLVPSINDAFITPPPPQPNPKWLVPSINVRGWPLFMRGWRGFSVRGWLVCNVRRWLAFNVRRWRVNRWGLQPDDFWSSWNAGYDPHGALQVDGLNTFWY